MLFLHQFMYFSHGASTKASTTDQTNSFSLSHKKHGKCTTMIRTLLGRKRQLPALQLQQCLSTASVQDIPIVIVGGGPSGLMLSNLLSTYQVPSVLLEAQSPHFHHPQAHFLNTRTMEILSAELPETWERVREAMPNVEHWRYFQFGHSASSGIMARVTHPVDVPLGRGDANGVLLPQGQMTAPRTPPSSNPLSDVSVGHLAQHTFSRILYEEAIKQDASQLMYDTAVTNVELHDDNHYVTSTANGASFRSKVVVAADGSNSKLRRNWNIGWKGQEGIQDLVNLHFSTSPEIAARLPPAMLYSIFSPKLVGMMVCHSPGEYVLQIPYFPPYQTLERDFSLPKATEMVHAALGFSDESIVIQSIKTWKMSSLIATQYHAGPGGVLIGDAAHVFPPAGGFGMNTGLQDAHALAWRLAKHHYDKGATMVTPALCEYGRERRLIAQQNAALSVRNYQRILHLTKACYLNNQHPEAVIAMLNGLSGILSMERRQTIFANLVQTAMWPLSSLAEPSSFHARHLTNNVRSILEQGGGLPLLFPKLELGFGYDRAKNLVEHHRTSKDDTMGFSPVVKEGHLLPHVELLVLKGRSCERLMVGSTISASHLYAELRVGIQPCFVLVAFGWDSELPSVIQLFQKQGAATAVRVVHIVSQGSSTSPVHDDVVLQDTHAYLYNLVGAEPTLVLVRPDGHVARVIKESENVQGDLASALGK
jgi:2-polyprenyl-6-methoxyphenol hydroxylase-like FAD-dependent oxidoreductase